MHDELSEDLVRTWVDGWDRTRGDEVVHAGTSLTVTPRTDHGVSETVLYLPREDDLRRAAATIARDPHHLLTLISTAGAAPPGRGETGDLELISDHEKLMVTDMELQDVEAPIVPDSFSVVRETFDGWTLLSVIQAGRIVGRGRMAVVDGYAVLDRIFTASTHRRRGLGTFVTRALLAIAHEHGVDKGLLVATGEGVELYEHLGWSHLADVRVFGAPGARNQRLPSHAQIDEELG